MFHYNRDSLKTELLFYNTTFSAFVLKRHPLRHDTLSFQRNCPIMSHNTKIFTETTFRGD